MLDFTFFEGHPSTLWHFEMRDRRDPDEPRDGIFDCGLDAWIAFLEHAKEGKNMSDVTHPAVQRAMHKLQELSLNEEDRFRALARERALMTEMSMLSGARAEGREQGSGRTGARGHGWVDEPMTLRAGSDRPKPLMQDTALRPEGPPAYAPWPASTRAKAAKVSCPLPVAPVSRMAKSMALKLAARAAISSR